MSKRPVICTLLLLLVSACSTPSTPTALPMTPEAQETTTPVPLPTVTVGVVPEASGEISSLGQIRLIHAAPESGVVDVYLESALIAGRLSPGGVTSPVSLPEGAYYLQVVPVNARPSTQVLADLALTVEPEKSLFILVAGAADAINIEVYEENLSPVQDGQSRLSFLHAVPRGPAFAPLVDGSSVDSEVDFGQLGTSTVLASGPHEIRLDSGPVTLLSTTLSLSVGYAHTAVLFGDIGGGSYKASLISTPILAPGRIRLVNTLADSSVELHLDGTSYAASVASRSWSDWREVRPRTYSLTVTDPSGDPEAQALVDTLFNPASGRAYIAVIYSDTGTPSLRIFEVPLTPTRPDRAMLTVFNAASEAPSIQPQSPDSLLASISPTRFGTASRPYEILASSTNLFWVASEGGELRVLESMPDYTFEEGQAYTYIVTGQGDSPIIIADPVGILNDSANAPSVSHTVMVRVINGLPESIPVSVALDDIELASNLPQAESSVPRVLPGASYQLEATTDRATLTTEIPLLNLNRAAILISGQADDLQASVIQEYHTAVQRGQTILRLVHVAPMVGPVIARLEVPETQDSGLDSITPIATLDAAAERRRDERRILETAPFGSNESSEFITVPPNTYLLEVIARDTKQTLGLIPRLTLEGGTLYDLLLLPGTEPDTLDPVLISRTN